MTAALALLGCGSAEVGPGIVHDACRPLQVIAGEDSLPSERAGVAEGITLWREVGVTAPRLEAAADGDRVPVNFELAPAAFRGVYEPSRGEVFVNRRLDEPHQRAITVAHELGHALGLEHVALAERESVMNPANVTVSPTRSDVEALADIWGECLDVP
jgi:hypothetical protein